VGIGLYATPEEAFAGLKAVETVQPDTRRDEYERAYATWRSELNSALTATKGR
jgi:xylulokinase